MAIVAITCTDSSTGPGPTHPAALTPGRLSLTPQFTPEAARAYSILRAIGTDVTQIHVQLTAADGAIAVRPTPSPPIASTVRTRSTLPARRRWPPGSPHRPA